MRLTLLCALVAVAAAGADRAAAEVGFLDARGDHRDPRLTLTERGAALAATRVGPTGAMPTEVSVSSRPGPLTQWSRPRRFAAAGVLEHRVALNERRDALVVWRGAQGIHAAWRRGPRGRWRVGPVPAADGATRITFAGVTRDGVAHLLLRSPAGYLHLTRAGAWSDPAPAPIPAGADLSEAGAALERTGRLIVAWRTADGVIAMSRLGPGATVETLDADAAGAPVVATGGAHAALAWAGAGGAPRLVHLSTGGTVFAGPGRVAAGAAIDLAVAATGGALAQWTAADGSGIGGSYWSPKRGRWIATASAWGRGFLRSRAVFFADPAREGGRRRVGLPPGELRAPETTLRVVHADGRGDVSALLRATGGTTAVLRRRAPQGSVWRTAAVAGLGGAAITAGNARGDVVVAFLSPSEFVEGDLNSAVASVSPSIEIDAARTTAARRRLRVRLTLPDTGAVRLRLVDARGRVVSGRGFGAGRGVRGLVLTPPGRPGGYRLRVTLRGADGRGYSASRPLRVR